MNMSMGSMIFMYSDLLEQYLITHFLIYYAKEHNIDISEHTNILKNYGGNNPHILRLKELADY